MAVACHAALANAQGAIVNIASMHAIFGAPLSPGYAASKVGVVQLTKSLAVACAHEGVRVNAIAPGWIETPMTVPARSDAARNRAILDRTPLGRWGTPDDIVGPCEAEGGGADAWADEAPALAGLAPGSVQGTVAVASLGTRLRLTRRIPVDDDRHVRLRGRHHSVDEEA